MYHPKEKEEILNLQEKTELIKNRKFGLHHHCNLKENEILQELIRNDQAFVSHFETNSTLQTSSYDALVVCNNKEYYLVKWKN
jgi:UDP-N-acetylglucosamine transferase subunit ALG13